MDDGDDVIETFSIDPDTWNSAFISCDVLNEDPLFTREASQRGWMDAKQARQAARYREMDKRIRKLLLIPHDERYVWLHVVVYATYVEVKGVKYTQ